MTKKKLSIAEVWNYSDPREVPAYSAVEAAQYLCIPTTTIRSWISGTKSARKVIDLPRPNHLLLSFFNLVEAHALRSLRTIHGINLPRIRRALDHVKSKRGWERPLIHEGFMRDGVRLFIEHLGHIVDAGARGQIAIQEVMRAHLERIEWENELAARLYPFTRLNGSDGPRSVFIDPRFSFGRPILKESHIATAVIAERYKAGDSVDNLAQDYGCSRLEIEEGVRCELRLEAAA